MIVKMREERDRAVCPRRAGRYERSQGHMGSGVVERNRAGCVVRPCSIVEGHRRILGAIKNWKEINCRIGPGRSGTGTEPVRHRQSIDPGFLFLGLLTPPISDPSMGCDGVRQGGPCFVLVGCIDVDVSGRTTSSGIAGNGHILRIPSIGP